MQMTKIKVNKYVTLDKVAYFANEKIESKYLNNKNYISTENMLPDKSGITISLSNPQGNNKSKFSEDDILLSNIRPYFRKIWFANISGGCSNDILVLKAKDNICPKFLYYALSDNNFFNYATVTSKGTKMPRGSKHAIMKYLVPNLDQSEQKRITNILSTYDDLIENNNRRIELLEKSAQELYKEWFVRFRFPNYENTKFVNGLPEGWSKGKFKNNVKYITGKLDSNAMKDEGEFSFYTCAKTIYKTNTFCFDGECVLLGGNNATGDFSLFYANEKLDAYQRTYIITPLNNNIGCSYIYFVLKNYLMHLKHASIGATTKFLTKSILDKINIVLPDKMIANQFNKIVSSIFLEMSKLKLNNVNLKKQRDLLLPRLISGKLEV